MIVDDNAVNLKLVREILSVEGYNTFTSSSAEEAMEKLAIEKIDTILMDIALPGMDGLQLTRQLKTTKATQHIRIIAITAFAMKGDMEKALESGCDGFITKPINTRSFVTEIKSFL